MTITFAAAPILNAIILIKRVQLLTQSVSIQNNSGYLAAAAESMGDVLVQQVQQVADEVAAYLVPGGVTLQDGNKGDITVSAAGTTFAINTGVVSLTKMALLTSTTILGNNTGVAATPIALTPAQISAMLNATIAPVFANNTAKPTTLAGYGITDGQVLDTDLTTIAGLTATTDSFLQSKASAWSTRSIAQVMADLGLTGVNSGDQTITLSGAVTGSGTGAITTALGTAAAVNSQVFTGTPSLPTAA